jgi:hypothetical protein
MPFVSARIPTSFTCTSTCKTAVSISSVSMGAPERSGRLCSSKAAAARSLRKVGKNTGIFFTTKDTKNPEEKPKK